MSGEACIRRSLLAIFVAGCLGAAATGCGSDSGHTAHAARTHATDRSSRSDIDVVRLTRTMSNAQKVGQLFVTTVPGTAASAATRRLITDYHVGGVIYFGDNLRSARQVAALSTGLQRAAQANGGTVPLFIGTDQEGGLVQRLAGITTDFPGNMALGATRSTSLTRAAAKATGAELRILGINLDYAPDADVNVNPRNPVIGIRSFSANAGLAARLTGAAVDGYRAGRVTATAKHFPGHGDTATDSHTGLPVVTHSPARWRKVDAPPFRTAIRHHVGMIMTAHVMMPNLDASRAPATLSTKILGGLLRKRLGYRGVVTTDSLEMAGVRQRYGDGTVAVRALEAGADQLLQPPDLKRDYRAVLHAVNTGQISEHRLDQSVKRILTLKARQGLFTTHSPAPGHAASSVRTAAHRAVAGRIARASVTLLRNSGHKGRHTLPLRAHSRVFVTGPGAAAIAVTLRSRGYRTTAMGTQTAPGVAAVATAKSHAAHADATVVVTRDAASSPAQRGLVGALTATGKPVVAVASGGPYDISSFPDVDAYLATYSDSGVSLPAAGDVIAGKLAPRGKLPVTIPSSGGGKALYRYGDGLRR